MNKEKDKVIRDIVKNAIKDGCKSDVAETIALWCVYGEKEASRKYPSLVEMGKDSGLCGTGKDKRLALDRENVGIDFILCCLACEGMVKRVKAKKEG